MQLNGRLATSIGRSAKFGSLIVASKVIFLESVTLPKNIKTSQRKRIGARRRKTIVITA